MSVGALELTARSGKLHADRPVEVETIQFSRNAPETEAQSEWSTSLFRAVEELIRSGGQQTSSPSEDRRILSPTSSRGSSGSNNFGPVNPWDDWSSDAGTAKESQQGGSVTDMWSGSSDVSAISDTTTSPTPHRPPPRSAIPSHYASDEGIIRFEENAWPYEREEQARSWVTAREPTTMVKMPNIEEAHNPDLPTAMVWEEPAIVPSRRNWGRWRQKRVEVPASEDSSSIRQAEHVPTASPVAKTATWYSQPFTRSSQTLASVSDAATLPTSPSDSNGQAEHVPPTSPVAKTASWYSQPFARSSQKLANISTATLPTIPSITARFEYEYNQQPSSRPRSQTEISSPPSPISKWRPISSSSVPYQTSMSSSTPIPSIILRAPTEESSNGVASSRQREYFSPDSIGSKTSRSMRRKAAMEAAVGNERGE